MTFFPDKPIVLASASPRRAALLRQLGVEPLVCPAETEEYQDAAAWGGTAGLAEANARRKATAVATRYPEALVVAADTLVACNGRLLGKPADGAEARAMLRFLSGRQHQVYTGLCLATEAGRLASGTAEASVWFHSLSEAEIAAYVASGAPLDKAGAYGIQEAGGWFVARIEGDYTTVVGLSFSLLRDLLGQLFQ